jgi:hypothetical protein
MHGYPGCYPGHHSQKHLTFLCFPLLVLLEKAWLNHPVGAGVSERWLSPGHKLIADGVIVRQLIILSAWGTPIKRFFILNL